MSASSLPSLGRWQALGPCLDELLALDPGRRRARLSHLRRDDPELAAEVAGLLAVADRAEAAGFLSGRADAGLEADGDDADDWVGRRLGAFTAEALLGRGGTASVWRARRAGDPSSAAVALKVARATMPAGMASAQLRSEQSILRRLGHSNIVRLVDAPAMDPARPHLVLECIEGAAINRHCDAAGLSVPGRLALVADLADALQHAHAIGVVHCDVKPSNVLVTAAGEVKLIDFGSAVSIDGRRAGRRTACVPVRASFTPAFAAPEQRRGECVGEATDVHGVGVLAYELVAGRPPFRASRSGAGLPVRSGADEPLPLRRAWGDCAAEVEAMRRAALQRGMSLAAFRAVLESGLQDVIAKAIDRDPARRQRSTTELASDLADWQRGSAGGVSSRPACPPRFAAIDAALTGAASDTAAPRRRP